MITRIHGILEIFKRKVDWNDNNSVADYYYLLSKTIEKLQTFLEKPKKILLESKKTIFYPGNKEKIQFQEGRDNIIIDGKEFGQFMIGENRLIDLLSVISITKKSLIDTLPDGEYLSVKFKKVIGSTVPSIGIKPMTKDELKKFND